VSKTETKWPRWGAYSAPKLNEEEEESEGILRTGRSKGRKRVESKDVKK